MTTYIALIYTTEVDWSRPEYADGVREYVAFNEAHAAILRGGHALYPTATGEAVVTDGPYAETKEALTGFMLLECADLDEAIAVAEEIPAARYGTVEIRPIHPSLGV
jgi:hypothetical protein